MIPVYQPTLGEKEKQNVMECLDSTWISSKGRFVRAFESEFAAYIGTKYGTAVNNGTVALHLALLALGIGKGDEVIVPSLTYVASVNTIHYTGATPVFADSLLSTWQVDPDDIERKITRQTRAILLVHLYGYPCDMDRIMEIAKKHNIFVIEDCAEAIGSEYKGKKVGTFGDIACFSFFGNKTITTGEGGMVLTNDATLYERSCRLKDQGTAKDREYWHDIIGYNYRMTNICAAIGLGQLERAEEFIEKKIAIAEYYSKRLEKAPVVCHKNADPTNIRHTYWMFSILARDAEERAALRSHMKEDGIETRPTFYPAHTLPMYSEKYQKLPTAESIGWRGINLPSWPMLTQEQLDTVCDSILSFYDGRS